MRRPIEVTTQSGRHIGNAEKRFKAELVAQEIMSGPKSIKQTKTIITLAAAGAILLLSITTHDRDDQSWYSGCHDENDRRFSEYEHMSKLRGEVEDAERRLVQAEVSRDEEASRQLKYEIANLTITLEEFMTTTGDRFAAYLRECQMGNSMRAIQNRWPVGSDGKPESYDHHWRWSRSSNLHK